MIKLPPHNQTYWQGAESHESFVDKSFYPIVIPGGPNESKLTKKTIRYFPQESHSDKPIVTNNNSTCGCGVTRQL